jgi:hypothetical protein
MSADKPSEANKPAAADQPMQIVSAASNEENTSITVTWNAVNYGTGAQSYNVTVVCVGYSQDNFPQPDAAATSLDCPYTTQEGRSYQTFVVPINKGNPVNKWQSPVVPIPYPPA